MSSGTYNQDAGEIFARSTAVFAGHSMPLAGHGMSGTADKAVFARLFTIFRPRTNFFAVAYPLLNQTADNN